jgi:hypothetical protein
VHHRTIKINHQPDATIFHFIILTFIYSSTCFGHSPAHHQELNDCSSSLRFYLRIVVVAVLCSWSGRPARPQTQHGYHHDTTVKPEAATAVIQLLMMGGRTPKTCWAVNKCRDNKLENCCIWLVIYLNHWLAVSYYMWSSDGMSCTCQLYSLEQWVFICHTFCKVCILEKMLPELGKKNVPCQEHHVKEHSA